MLPLPLGPCRVYSHPCCLYSAAREKDAPLVPNVTGATGRSLQGSPGGGPAHRGEVTTREACEVERHMGATAPALGSKIRLVRPRAYEASTRASLAALLPLASCFTVLQVCSASTGTARRPLASSSVADPSSPTPCAPPARPAGPGGAMCMAPGSFEGPHAAWGWVLHPGPGLRGQGCTAAGHCGRDAGAQGVECRHAWVSCVHLCACMCTNMPLWLPFNIRSALR